MKTNQVTSAILITFISLAISLNCFSRTFYISSNGDDSNDGQSMGAAWKSLQNVNQNTFSAGDNILFEGGATFSGTISNPNKFFGTIDQPIVFGSFGVGKATIASGTGNGFNLEGNNVIIQDLVFKGDGYMSMDFNTHGILGYIEELASSPFDNLKIDNVEAFGYGGWGCLLYSDAQNFGFDDLDIQNSVFHDNGYGGMFVYGYYVPLEKSTRNSHNGYFNNNKFYNNYGRTDKTNSWSGCGLVVFGMIDGIIENCEAYNNGEKNSFRYAGPVGIMVAESEQITVQHCSSHDNKSGNPTQKFNDGGGFCLDGGTEKCVIQYCEAYNNWGAGYGIYQFAGAGPSGYDTIRYCKSSNDAENNFYGSITLWGSDSSNMVKNAFVYSNEINQSVNLRIALRTLYRFIENCSADSNSFCLANGARYTNPTPLPGTSITNSLFPCSTLPVNIRSFQIKRVN